MVVGSTVRELVVGVSSPAACAIAEIWEANDENWGVIAAGMLKLKQNEGPPPLALPCCED